jgi:hypothetical protein
MCFTLAFIFSYFGMVRFFKITIQHKFTIRSFPLFFSFFPGQTAHVYHVRFKFPFHVIILFLIQWLFRTRTERAFLSYMNFMLQPTARNYHVVLMCGHVICRYYIFRLLHNLATYKGYCVLAF